MKGWTVGVLIMLPLLTAAGVGYAWYAKSDKEAAAKRQAEAARLAAEEAARKAEEERKARELAAAKKAKEDQDFKNGAKGVANALGLGLNFLFPGAGSVVSGIAGSVFA